MKLISLKCPECSSNLQIEEGRDKCFCQYCGAEISLNDYYSSHIYRKVDEARIKEAEYKKEVRVKQAEIDKEVSSYISYGTYSLNLFVFKRKEITPHKGLRKFYVGSYFFAIFTAPIMKGGILYAKNE